MKFDFEKLLAEVQAAYEQAMKLNKTIYGTDDGSEDSQDEDAKKKKRDKKPFDPAESFRKAIREGKKREDTFIRINEEDQRQKAEDRKQRAKEQRKRDEEHAKRQKKAKAAEGQKAREAEAKKIAQAIERTRREERAKAKKAQEAASREDKSAAAKEAARFHPRHPDYLPKGCVTAPAIILKPKMDRAATGQEMIKLGGHPQLPEDIEWPGVEDDTPYHFFAQIDLASLPRRLEGQGYGFDIPDFPECGTLFVFVRLDGLNMFYDAPEVIYVEEPVADLPEREPPEETEPLRDMQDSQLRDDGIAQDGLSLRRQFVQPLAYMSARRPNMTPVEQAMLVDPQRPTGEIARALLDAGLELTLNEDTTNPETTASDTDWDRYVAQSTRVPASEHAVDSPYRFRWDMTQIQLFGHGDDVQNASADQEGNVLLLQLGNKFGTPLAMDDVVIQLWITPEDLAEGCFDYLEFTQDCS